MEHRHRAKGTAEIRCYRGSVAPAGRENRAAHGCVEEVARCRCGAIRRRNLNNGHVESSGWIEPMDGDPLP